jgi:hypothetical protein
MDPGPASGGIGHVAGDAIFGRRPCQFAHLGRIAGAPDGCPRQGWGRRQTGSVARAELAWDWTGLHELVALSSAADADELHRRLVLLPAADGNPADAFQPLCLLHQFHDDKREGATVTALLLVTDARWKHATGRLINAIATSGCVPDEDLDALAQVFLAAGPNCVLGGARRLVRRRICDRAPRRSLGRRGTPRGRPIAVRRGRPSGR